MLTRPTSHLPLLLALGLILWGSSVSPACAQAQHFYRFLVRTDEEYNRIFQQGLMVVLAKPGVYVDAMATGAQARQLEALGIRAQLVQSDLEGMIERLRAASDMGAYHTDAELQTTLAELARRHPTRVQVVPIGRSWETERGLARRPILAVKVCNDVNRADDLRAEALYFGAIHARELATTEVLLATIKYLLDHAGRDPEVDFLLTYRQLWFIPSLNPDGREYALTQDMWWRKNRRALSQGGPVGVDLNRNFGYHWGDTQMAGGSSADPYSATYRGERAFSEPESQALRKFAASRKFTASLAYHSYGQYLLYPFGFSDQPVEDLAAYQEIARELTRVNRYPAGDVHSTVGYYSTGRHDDWLYGERREKPKVMAFEIELGRTFFPPEEDLPKLFEEIRHCNLALARRAGADLEVRWTVSAGSRALSVQVVNRGLKPATGVTLRLRGPSDVRIGGDSRVVRRLDGLLDRSNGSDRLAAVFPLSRGEDTESGDPETPASVPNRALPLVLQLSYTDGNAVARTIPVSFPAD